MGFGDFQLNNNGKREQLHDVKQGVRKEQLDKKFHALFDAYDANKDGTLETDELNGILKGLQSFAGADKVLDSNENLQVTSIFASEANIQDADFQGFVKSVSTASADILETKEKQTSDGGKEVTTTYNDGTTETIAFYNNGDYKWKKTEKRTLETTYEMVYNGQKRQLNESEFKKVLAKIEEKKNAKMQKTSLEGKSFKVPVSESVSAFANTTEKVEKKEVYSPRYIAETLGVNIETEDGKKVVERLSQLSQETLEKLKDGKELKELIASQELEPTFDNISNVLEITEGVTLRNEEEYKATEAQRQEILTQIKAANFMANVYETLASYNDQYTDSVGLFGLGSEGIGYVLNKLGLDGENHYQFADSCREWAKNASELKVLNPQKFKEGFKNIYGDNAKNWGIDYNSYAFKKCFALAESGKAYDKDNKMTDEYKEAIHKAMNFVADDPNDSTFNQVMNGFGEAVLMIATLGWGAETKAGATLATTTMGTFSKAGVAIASKQVNNKLLQGALRFTGKAVKLVGPALNEGTKMYLYTAAEGTLTNVSNRAIKQDDKFLDTQAGVMTNAEGSFTFGAFAGVFGSTVTQRVMQAVSKTSSKVTTALADKFSQGPVDANKVFATIMEKSVPTRIAEVAAFATDVVGFTAFESALSIANTLQREGSLTPEKLANTLMEEFKNQGYSLGQIKVISHLIMTLVGSRSARMQSQKYLQENLPQLKGATVDWLNGGKDGFKINLPNGKKVECKNASEMIASIQLMARGETALSHLFNNGNAKAESRKTAPKAQASAEYKGKTKVGESAQTEYRNSQEPAILSRLETANNRETFVAIRDEINKMPAGKEKTQLMKEYLKKYNEWSASPERPNIRMQYMPEGIREYKANNILDKAFDETTIPKSKSRLKEMGFTEEEINSIDLKDANVQRTVEVFSALFKFKPEMKEEYSNAEIVEFLGDKEGQKTFLEEEVKFFTVENCEILTKNVIFDKSGDITEILSDYNNPEKIMNLLPMLTQNGKHKIFGSQFLVLSYKLDNPENVTKITTEKVDLMYKINDQIENKEFGIELDQILELDNMRPELANDYIKEANRFSKYGIKNIQGKTLEEIVAKRKAVSDFLEQYPIDFTCKDYEGNLSKLSGDAVYELSQSTNKAEVQKFINSLSEKARENYAGYSSYVDKGFSAEKLSKLINEYRKGDFGEIQGDIYKLLDAMLETGSKDYDSMIDLINAYKGTRVLSWYGNEKHVQVANGDYKGAMKYIELAKVLGMNEEHFNSLITDKNADFKTVEACLTYVKENKIDLSSYSDYHLLRDNNWKENIGKIEYLKEQGVNNGDRSIPLDFLHQYICTDLKSDISLKEFKEKFEFINDFINANKGADYRGYDTVYSKTQFANSSLIMSEVTKLQNLAKLANIKPAEVLELLVKANKENLAFAEKLCADKEFPKEHVAPILKATNKDNIILAEKCCADKEFPKEHIVPILNATNKDSITFAEKLCADKEFSKEHVASILNAINKKNIAFAEKLCADKEFPKEHIASILNATNKDKIAFAEKLYADKDFPKEHIAPILKSTNKDNVILAKKLCADKEFPKEHVAGIVGAINKDNIALVEKLYVDNEFPKEHIADIVRATNKDNITFAEKLCADKEFPKEYIANIVRATNKDNITFAEKLCADKEFPKEHVASILNATNKDKIAFAEKLCAYKNIPKDKIPEIINATKINDPNDAGGNNGKTDSKKIDRYSRLFQNQATAKWAGDMLKQGFDIETISKLAPTKQSFFTESVDNVASKQVVETQKALSPLETIRVETIKEFESIGLDTKQANAVYKAISKNGVVDALLKSKAIDLINKGVAKNKIGDILNSAQITGEFNSKIVDDFILLQNRGLNPLLEKNLAVLNNISGADCATKFNSKVRNQMKAMINNLPDAVKISLKEQGVEIDSILKKLDSQVVRTSNNVPTRAKVESGFRSKAKITGFERIVIDKYEPTEQIWRNEEATKKWAEEKYTEYKNREYVSTRNTSEDPQLGEKVTQKRKEMLQEWYNFMETDENIKNNPFVKVILCDFITKELEPERSTTPPVLDKDVVKQILGDAANSSNFSFSNAYTKKMKELSAKNSSGQQVEINGRKGTWYTVPKTDSSSLDFKANAAKIRAFSDGTNWCIRTWNAEPYVQKGAMHFFVDENGLTQICIRESGAPGSVYEIQKDNKTNLLR